MDNTSLFYLIYNLNGQSFLLDQIAIFGAVDLIYLSFGLLLLLALKGGIAEKKSALLIILGIPLAVIIIKLIHIFYFEPRPFIAFNFPPVVPESADAAFPSRHASISAVLAFAYFYYRSKWAPLYLFFMIWIGFGRIFAGVHYPLDVLGGFATGFISILLAVLIKKLLKKTVLRI